MAMRPRYGEMGKSNLSWSTLMLVVGVALVAAASANAQHVLAQSKVEPSVIQAEPAQSQLAGPYRTWLDEDVHWIITANEQSAYMALQTNQERMQFINEFWQHRNPDQNNSENRFKEEHYRRLAYANTHFAATQAGWMTDRGRIYIIYGQPDSIDAHPSGAADEFSPFEIWHYRKLQNRVYSGGVDVKFVDTCKCGDYKLASPPNL